MHMIYTYAGAQPEDEVWRWDQKHKKYRNIKGPYFYQEYNKFMGSIYLMNRMTAYYPNGFKN